MVQQIVFVLLLIISIYFFSKKINEIKRNINLGKEEDLSDNKKQRWKNVVLLALGQRKMFKNIPIAIMHLIIYAGFIIINAEVLEIILDGITGKHRIFAGLLGSFYTFLINSFEILALLIIIVCVIFLVRRNVLKIKRFMNNELNGWPRSDANYILIAEIILMSLFITMNAADLNLQQLNSHYPSTGKFIVSGLLSPLMQNLNEGTLIGIERTCWWLHIVGIFVFLNYLPYSKHLHILLAFPNSYYTRLTPAGLMSNMPFIQNEVLYAMQPELAPTNAAPAPNHFGAKDVTDLSWKSLMDAYSCTECGRCTAACPANQTGKLLSPRKIMMDTRDRLEEVGKNITKNGSFVDDSKSLLNDYITVEELRACTTCNACVEECPVSISPLSIIVELRRHLILDASSAPNEWNAMFGNIENNSAPWKFSPDDRDAWTKQ
jgi:ferredoxin